MRRADDIGAETRRTLGDPGPGASDDAFLAALSIGRRRQIRNRRRLAGAVVLVALGVVWSLAPTNHDEPEPTATPTVTRRETALVDDPEAALLLEAARLRLEGFGDPAVAPRKLEEVVMRYPGSRSALLAAALLRDLEGSRR